MQTNKTNNLKLLGTLLLGLASATAFAGDVTYNFDIGGNPATGDPGQDPSFLVFGPSFGNDWSSIDGNPASGGFLAITFAQGSQGLGMVFPDVDLYTNTDGSVISLPVKAFKFEMDLRVGNGTTERPADGFSLSFARPGDVRLVNATNFNGTTSFVGWAGGDSDTEATSAAGSSDAENGTKTGLAICFDAWEGNTLPHNGILTGTTGSDDREGITVRLDDVTLFQQRNTNADGTLDRNGNCTTSNGGYPACNTAACNDQNTSQTGGWDGGTGDYHSLCWQHFSAELTTNKQIIVIWKGRTNANLTISSYSSSRGRLVFGGRTGGNNQNIHVDNVHITTVPDVVATFASIVPAGQGGLFGFKLTYQSTGPSIITNWNSVKLDTGGVTNDITSSVVLSTAGQFVSATYLGATRLLAGATYHVTGTAKDATGQTIQIAAAANFTTPNWISVPTNSVLTLAQVHNRGFKIRSYQTLFYRGVQPNNNYWTDEMFAGYHGPNFANQSGAVNGIFTFNGAADFSSGAAGDAGFFPFSGINGAGNTGGEDNALANLGIGGATNLAGAHINDNCALEIMSYVYFPTSGIYQMFVGGDDGFRLSLSGNSQDRIGTTIMECACGRGIGTSYTSATARSLIIDKPGVYPLRLTWENGGGGAALEWYTAHTNGLATDAGGDHANYALVNAQDTQGGFIVLSELQAFQDADVTTPYISRAIPAKDAGNVPLDEPVTIDITDGTLTLNSSSIVFKLDGATTPVTKTTPSAGVTRLVYTPTVGWAQGSVHNVLLTFADSSGTTNTEAWSFSVENNSGFPVVHIPASWGVPLSQIDTTRPGVKIRSVESPLRAANLDTAEANTIAWIEEQFMGQHGANVANDGVTAAAPTDNGYFDWTRQIDFSGATNPPSSARVGGSGAGFPYDAFVNDIGIPINAADNNNPKEPDTCGAIFSTWLYFAQPGAYSFEVSSDDGFKITASPRKDPMDQFGTALNWFNAGRGTSGRYGGTKNTFWIDAPGAYPLRLIWENGSGGCAVEWVLWQRLPDGGYDALLVGETNVPGAVVAYQAALVERPHLLGVYPSVDQANRIIGTVNGLDHHGFSPSQNIAFTLQSGSAALNVGAGQIQVLANGVPAPGPVTVTSLGSNSLYLVSVVPDANNTATWWPSGFAGDLSLIYSDANGTYTNTFKLATQFYGTLAAGYPVGSGDESKRGFLLRTWKVDQTGGVNTANRLGVWEQELAGMYGPNYTNPAKAYGRDMTADGYFIIGTNAINPSATNSVVNFDASPANGDFQANNGHPDEPFPGLPGVSSGVGASGSHLTDSISVELLTYVEFPTNGVYTMTFTSDDGYRVTRGWAAPANKNQVVVNSPAAVAGVLASAPGSYTGSRELMAPLTGKLVQALGVGGGVQTSTRPGVPIEGCPPLVNAPALAGNIAVFYGRSTCNSFEKFTAAKAAGALAVLVINDRPNLPSGNTDDWLPTEYGTTILVDIPVVMIGMTNGNQLIAAMATNDVNVTLMPLDLQANPDPTHSPLGQADYGKGAAGQSLTAPHVTGGEDFKVIVPAAGLYPLRAVYGNGSGGVNAEWSSFVGGSRVLLNDFSSASPALKTYYALAPGVKPALGISVSGSSVTITNTGTLQSAPTVTGPWTDVYGDGPVTVPASGAAKFWRAR